MNKTKVLFFLPRWSNGGMERAAINIAKYSRSSKFEYTFLVGNFEEDYAVNELNALGIKLIRLQKYADYSFKAVVKKFDEYLSENKCDIVHCHINNPIGLIFAFCAKRRGARIVAVQTHNNAFGSGRLFLKKILRRISMLLFSGYPDLYFACSEEAGQWTFGKKACGSRYYVVYNGVDADKFKFNPDFRNKLRARFNLEDKFVIGHIGHFNHQKNHELLIKMIPSLIERIPNAHLFLIGTGETKDDIIRLSQQNKSASYITLLGSVDDVYKYYSLFDAFVLPSVFEGFGIVAVEAQYNGLSVVASDNVPLATDVSGTIKYLSVDEPDSLNNWVTRLFEISVSSGKRNTVFDTDKFDNRLITEKIEAAYCKALGE